MIEKIPPFHLVSRFFEQIPKGLVLDIGAGKGRNSFFLAKNKFRVEAIDVNKDNVENIKKMSKTHSWLIKAKCSDFRKFRFIPSKYSSILAIQCFNFIKKSEFDKIIEKIKESLSSNGILIISVFTTADPTHKKLRKKYKPIEENTFYSKKIPHWWHFFKKNELKKYFKSGYEILHYKEKIVEDKKPQPHFHGIGEMVVKKISE